MVLSQLCLHKKDQWKCFFMVELAYHETKFFINWNMGGFFSTWTKMESSFHKAVINIVKQCISNNLSWRVVCCNKVFKIGKPNILSPSKTKTHICYCYRYRYCYCIKATGHNIKWYHFEILASEKTDYHCKTETLFLQECNTNLNTNLCLVWYFSYETSMMA